MKRTLSLLLLAFLSITLFAQRYEGEKDKKGKPDGFGKMYFDVSYLGKDCQEIIEGTFEKGIPIRGKSFRYNKEDGRIRMKFEGDFTVRYKRKKIESLDDLIAVGNVVFYNYDENSERYGLYGYIVEWGHLTEKGINDGYWLSAKKKKMGKIIDGKWGKAGSTGEFTPEGQKYYNELDSIKKAYKKPKPVYDQPALLKSLEELDKGLNRWRAASNAVSLITEIFKKNPMLCYINDKKAEQVTDFIIQKYQADKNRFKFRSDIDEILEYMPEKVYNSAKFKNFLFRYVAYDGGIRISKTFDDYTRADYYKYYHDYADLSDKEIKNWDDEAFNGIFNLSDVEYYMEVLPQGRHINEVKSLYSNGTGAGLTKYQIGLLDKAETDLRTYIVERTEKGRSSKFFLGDQRLADVVTMRTPTYLYKYEVEGKIPFKYGAVANLLKKNSKDNNVLRKAEKILKYITILDGFWAMNNSKDLKNCIEKNLWTAVTISPKAPVITSSFGVKVRESFEEAEKALTDFSNDPTMKKLYNRFVNSHSEFTNNLKGSIQNANEKYNQYKKEDSSYKEYKIDDDVLIIYLKNGDRYRFKSINGKWSYLEGHTTSSYKLSQQYGTIDGAIKACEQANKNYWEQ